MPFAQNCRKMNEAIFQLQLPTDHLLIYLQPVLIWHTDKDY